MTIEEHGFKHNFIICTKLKQPSIIGLDFVQRYNLTDKQETNEKICVVTQHTVTLLPNYISIVPLKPIHYAANLHTKKLIEIKENHFFSIEQSNITIIPALKKLDSRTSDKCMANGKLDSRTTDKFMANGTQHFSITLCSNCSLDILMIF